MPSATMHPTPISNSNSSSFRHSTASFSEDEEDIFITIDTLNDRDGHFLAIEQPRGGASLIKRDSLNREEKQIGVDPISLQGSNNNNHNNIRKASFKLISTPPRPPSSATGSGNGLDPKPPLPPPKLKFVSGSLPNSASPSPRSGSILNRIWKNESEGSPRVGNRMVSRQYSAVDDVDIVLQESSVRRSKSLREGTAADDFDLMLERPGHHDFDLTLDRPSQAGGRGSNYEATYSFQKPPTNSQGTNNQNRYVHSQSKRDQNNSSRESDHDNSMVTGGADDDRFNCGKLCLFLPRGKGKPVRASSSSSINTMASSGTTGVSSVHSMRSFKTADPPVISKRVSLERFDCGSWTSSVVINDDDHKEPTNLFFDLPMELIRCSVSDMQSTVTTAFVFDKDDEPKGVLKKTSASETDRKSKSQDSIARHVRFSTSSPAVSHTSSREDFNVLLDTQTT